MTKREYLAKLSNALQPYDSKIQQEIMRDYEEHFTIGSQEGKSETEIISSLGEIDDLLFLLNEPTQTNQKQSEESDAVHQTTKNVVLHGFTANVYVSISQDSKVNAKYINHGSSKEKLMYTFEGHQESDTFVLRLEQRERWMNFFSFTNNQPKMDIYLEIPKGLQSLAIKTLSGDCKIRDIHVDSLNIKTASGDVEVASVACQDVSISSASGDVDIKNTKASISLNTASGDVSIDNHSGNTLRITSASGDIDYNGACDVIDCKSASGDCDLTLQNDSQVKINVVSGDADIRLWSQSAGLASVYFSSVSGDIRCVHPSYQFKGRSLQYETSKLGTKIKINSVSGDVSIS